MRMVCNPAWGETMNSTHAGQPPELRIRRGGAYSASVSTAPDERNAPMSAQPSEPPAEPTDGGEAPPTKLFAAWIQEQRQGALHAELSEKLAELGAAVVDLQKGGTLTLKIAVAPAGKEQSAVVVTDEVKLKAPEDRGTSMFFTDKDGNMHRRDPRQPELPLRDVSKPQKPPREIGDK